MKLLGNYSNLLFVVYLLTLVPLYLQFSQVIFGQTQEILNENNVIELTANQIGNSYVWKNLELGFNPILNLKSNTDYTFLISSFQNDTAEHELKIEPRDGGEHIAESEEVEHGSLTQFVFNTGQPQVLKYYCVYHPDSMAGIVNITSTT